TSAGLGRSLHGASKFREGGDLGGAQQWDALGGWAFGGRVYWDRLLEFHPYSETRWSAQSSLAVRNDFNIAYRRPPGDTLASTGAWQTPFKWGTTGANSRCKRGRPRHVRRRERRRRRGTRPAHRYQREPDGGAPVRPPGGRNRRPAFLPFDRAAPRDRRKFRGERMSRTARGLPPAARGRAPDHDRGGPASGMDGARLPPRHRSRRGVVIQLGARGRAANT